MTIYGLSQTTGAERTLDVGRTAAGVRLRSSDGTSDLDGDAIQVDGGALIAALIDGPADRSTIRGTDAAGSALKRLDVAVRGNEVQLWVRTETGTGWDVAVGLDDLQDALEAAGDAA
jgi:hypothetical protein